MTNFGFLSDITEYALFAQAAIEAEKVWASSPARSGAAPPWRRASRAP